MAPRKGKASKGRSGPIPRDTTRPSVGVRIIGGRFRGRKLLYSGDLRTRPMKDRVRQAIFNLVGPAVVGTHAIDLFAGTGALGLEALSRGALRATFIEQHFPTANLLRRNLSELGVEDVAQVVNGDVFIWRRRRPELGSAPWLVFSSPPYDFYVHRTQQMLELLGGLLESAPGGSVLVVEADERFDFKVLPEPDSWDIRHYPPAVVGIVGKPRMTG